MPPSKILQGDKCAHWDYNVQEWLRPANHSNKSIVKGAYTLPLQNNLRKYRPHSCWWRKNLSSVYTKVNHKLHQLASDLISDEKNGKANLTELDIDRFVKAVDSHIWSMMLLLMRCRCDSTISSLPPVSHMKKVRCFYCLCVLLFITNSQCSTPVHIVLTGLYIYIYIYIYTTYWTLALVKRSRYSINYGLYLHLTHMLAIDKKLSGQGSQLATQNLLANSLWFPLIFYKSVILSTVEISMGAGMEQLCKPYHTHPADTQRSGSVTHSTYYSSGYLSLSASPKGAHHSSGYH